MKLAPDEGLVVDRVCLYERVRGADLIALRLAGKDFITGEPSTGKILVIGKAAAVEIIDYLSEITR